LGFQTCMWDPFGASAHDPYGALGTYLSGALGTCLAHWGPVWRMWDPFGVSVTRLAHWGPIWREWDPFGANLGPVWRVWDPFGACGTSSAHMHPFSANVTRLAQWGPVWHTGDLFGTSRADTRTYGPSNTTLSQRVSTPTAVEMVNVVITSTIKHLKTDQHVLGGGGQTSSVRFNDEGRRPRRIQIFKFCRLFFSLREGDYID